MLELGLKSTLTTDCTINIQHVVRSLFPCFSNKALSNYFFTASKEDFVGAGHG